MLWCILLLCSEKSLEEFAAAVLDGTAEAEYKSAPIPDEATDGGVTIIVGKNFESIVKDADKDVLLEVGSQALQRLSKRNKFVAVHIMFRVCHCQQRSAAATIQHAGLPGRAGQDT